MNKRSADSAADQNGEAASASSLFQKEYLKLKQSHTVRLVRSGLILLLASVLLVSAVLAWFVDTDIATGEGMGVNVNNSGGSVYVDAGVTLNEMVLIPAATKPDDAGVSGADLGKVIFIKRYNVRSKDGADVDATVTLPAGSRLHYLFLESNQPVTDSAYYGTYLKGHLADKDQPYVLDIADNQTMGSVVIIFYADFNDGGNQYNSYRARVSFTPAS